LKGICLDCGSTELKDTYISKGRRVYRPSCKFCLSKNIETESHFLYCDNCKNYSLFFDDVRFEIVCTHCGLVHGGTDHNIIYALGFLIRRPNYRFNEKNEKDIWRNCIK
jgi:ribosomal protein S27E